MREGKGSERGVHSLGRGFAGGGGGGGGQKLTNFLGHVFLDGGERRGEERWRMWRGL